MKLDDLLARLSDVEETPDGWLARCPAHDDSHASLRVTVSDTGKVLIRCRAGDATPKVMQALGLTMKDLASMTPDGTVPSRTATSQDVPASPADVAALAVRLDRYAEVLSTASVIGEPGDPGVDALSYARSRFGVSGDDIRRLGLGFADDLGGGPRLVVPFRDLEGVARGFQARALDPDATVRWRGPRSPEGASWSKIGYFPGSGSYSEVLITEGPGDALTAAAAGFDAIGVRGAGLASNPAAIDAIVSTADGRPVVIAGDGDVAGRRFASELADLLMGRGLVVKLLPMRQDKDLTDWRADDPDRFASDLLYHVAKAEVARSLTAALLAWDEDRYSLTDLGGARYLRDHIESVGSGVKYSEEAGFFLLHEGVWRKDDQQGVRTHAQAVGDLVRSLAMQASAAAKADGAGDDLVKRASRLNRYAAHAQTSRGLDAMLRELQAVQGVPARLSDFDRHDHLLAAKNGVINLRTGQLQPHDPGLLLTKRVEEDFNPDAKAPRWEKFLEEIFPAHPALPAYMQRLVGYGVTGQTDEQCFAVAWGTGANGKSIFTDALTGVFRELTVTTPFSTFEDRGSGGIPNDLAALKGSRLVMAAEGEQGRPMAESVLKRVTGRDMIAARFMRREFFEFRPTFLLVLATNFKPSFKGQDEGLWRRVKLIPFERYFAPEERDHQLGNTLLKEAPGILAWAVRGAVAWYAGGLQDPAVVKSSTKEYRETSDALAGFLPGTYIHAPDAGRVSGKILFEAYLQWADEENLPARERWTRRAFFAALEERGLVKRRIADGVAFDGVRRARVADRHPEEATPVVAEDTAPAYSIDKATKALTGPNLDDLL